MVMIRESEYVKFLEIIKKLEELEGKEIVEPDILSRLKQDSQFLRHLKAQGLDKWEGYQLARQAMHAENNQRHRDLMIADLAKREVKDGL